MPVFEFFQWTKETGYTLDESGPLIQVEVGIPAPLEEFCLAKGIQIPAPASGYALIDTGASATAVHEPLILELGIQPIDSIPTHTPHGGGRSFVYPTKVSFPGLNVQALPMDRVIGSELKWVTPDGKEIIMLLGRDLLQAFLLIYNGKYSNITLAY